MDITTCYILTSCSSHATKVYRNLLLLFFFFNRKQLLGTVRRLFAKSDCYYYSTHCIRVLLANLGDKLFVRDLD